MALLSLNESNASGCVKGFPLDYKELAQLAKACRKAGITQYKCPEFEFTLSADAPPKVTRKKAEPTSKQDLRPDKIDIDEFEGLSDEEKALWSASGGRAIEGVG